MPLLLSAFGAVIDARGIQLLKEPYKDWAESNINKIKNVLAQSRAEHTQAVKDRINSVEQMKDVVSLTQGLFAISKVGISFNFVWWTKDKLTFF